MRPQLILLFITLFFVSCTKIPTSQVTFHTQTPPGELKNTVFSYTHKGRTLNMRKMPDFVTTDIESYRSFPADDGVTYGAMFILKHTAAKRLLHFSTEKQGRYMVSVVNDKVSEPLVIDKPLTDGTLITWSDLTLRDIRALDIILPRTGEDKENWKERSKAAKKALKEAIKREKKNGKRGQ